MIDVFVTFLIVALLVAGVCVAVVEFCWFVEELERGEEWSA